MRRSGAQGATVRARIAGAIGLAAAAVALAGFGTAAPAGAAQGGDRSAVPPVELSPCLRWGESLPIELRRGSARQAIICLLNVERVDAGLVPLEQDRRLDRASQRHTKAMHGTRCFSHRCPGERRLKQRLGGYLAGKPRRYKYGEAIAWAPGPLASPRLVVDGLMASALHRAHILNPRYRHVGVGFTVGTPWSALAHGGIYTIDFGMRKG